MTIDIILFIVGAALVIFGADWLVDGASAVARKAKLSEFVIGATIVGIGTSMPELVVSIISAAGGSADMAVGNITGSNLFNLLLILGVTAIIRPIPYTKANIVRDLPMCIGVSLLLLIMALIPHPGERTIGRIDGAILLSLFGLYIWYNFRQKPTEEETVTETRNTWKIILLIIAGLAGLICGGKLFVDSAINLARSFNIPESVIATTLMAGGTSLPELAVCIMAAVKGRGQMAIGNIIGSNISNILLIIGASALISPLHIDPINMRGIIAVCASSIVFIFSALPLRSLQLSRFEGSIFTLLYIVYIVSIF